MQPLEKQKQSPEVFRKKNMLLKISQTSQENSVLKNLLLKLQAFSLQVF